MARHARYRMVSVCGLPVMYLGYRTLSPIQVEYQVFRFFWQGAA